MLVNTSLTTKRNCALTVIEVLVILAVLAILVVSLLPQFFREKRKALRIQCISNLKQIGLSCRVWEADHNGRYPMQVSQTEGGSMEYITGPNAFRHFQLISNELAAPKLLICPAEFDRARSWSTNFSTLSNSNLSYFASSDASEANPQAIVWGDRNLTNGTPEIDGVLGLAANHPVGWTEKMHHEVGNIVLADCSAWQLTDASLRDMVANSSLPTNRLQMPVLAP